MKKIVIPDSVEHIRTDAFAYCYSLEEVTLPASLKFLSHSAFYSCNSVKKINYCNHSIMVDDILPGVIKANELLCLNIDARILMSLVMDVVLRSWNRNYNGGFFNPITDIEILDSHGSIYY